MWLTSEELQALSLLINLLDTLGSNLLVARGVNATRFMNHARILPIGN